MFLATTALSEFWDPSQELLCLGSWCLRHDRRSEWASLRHRVLPCPWDDRERFYRAAQELEASGERLLRHLVDYLNAAHRVSCSERYWRILIGPWLLHYLHAIYDRHAHLADAFARHPDLQTIVMDAGSYRVPGDMTDAIEHLSGDAYNLQLFSQLLQEMGHRFPARPYGGPWTAPENGSATKARRPLRRLAKGGLHAAIRAAKRLQGARWRVAVHHLEYSDLLLWPLMLRMQFRVLPAQIQESWAHELPGPVWDDRRHGLRGLTSGSEFERLAVRLLPHHLPTLYLEGYHAARAAAMRYASAAPSVIISAAAWHFDEPFKFVAAEAARAGTRLIAVQHGGGYGLFRCCPPERHETGIGATFMAWGWADQQPGVRNLPYPKLSLWLAKPKPRPASTILFVATCQPRYLYQFHSTPVGSQWEAYIAWQLRFLRAMPEGPRSTVLFRPYAHDYGHGLRDRVATAFPEVRWDGGAPMLDRLHQSRLVVIDHLGTTLLETLALNIPTVLFWDPNRWEVRAEAAGDVDRLRRAGILCDAPEAAAANTMRAYADPGWWASDPVQAARRSFVERYALARRDWVEDWAEILECR